MVDKQSPRKNDKSPKSEMSPRKTPLDIPDMQAGVQNLKLSQEAERMRWERAQSDLREKARRDLEDAHIIFKSLHGIVPNSENDYGPLSNAQAAVLSQFSGHPQPLPDQLGFQIPNTFPAGRNQRSQILGSHIPPWPDNSHNPQPYPFDSNQLNNTNFIAQISSWAANRLIPTEAYQFGGLQYANPHPLPQLPIAESHQVDYSKPNLPFQATYQVPGSVSRTKERIGAITKAEFEDSRFENAFIPLEFGNSKGIKRS